MKEVERRYSRIREAMARDSLDAVIDGDVEEARIVASHDDRVDRIYHRIFDERVRVCAAGDDTAFRATMRWPAKPHAAAVSRVRSSGAA